MEPDHIPPPPYSETDVYSNSSDHARILTPPASVADNSPVAPRPALSTASSIDETIYTPPYSPASSLHQNQVGGDEIQSASVSSAAAYFESRPLRNTTLAGSSSLEIYNIVITPTTEPKDLPFAETLQAKDVNRQDWATFVNYLIPDYIVAANNDVADRKLAAEMIDERLQKFMLGPDDHISRSAPSEVDAQLSPLRQSQPPPSTTRLSSAKATISEWNQGFFGPRGVKIVIVDPNSEVVNRMPGAWPPWESETAPGGSRDNTGLGSRMGWGPFGGFRADADGFRLGKIQADGSGFRIGKMLVADQNGFRLGGRRGFIADANGVSLGGRNFGPSLPYKEASNPEPRRGRHRVPRRGRSHSRGWHDKGKGRSTSTDSSSSSSSSSSSDSGSSIGSLPEYEDLKDQQLPVVKRSLIEWLDHPDQPVTREGLKGMKQELKEAGRDGLRPLDQDMVVLRKEVKELMKKFKEGKRAQRKQRKETRRIRRAEKKKAKKERREARKSKRDERACNGRGFGGRGRGWAGPYMPTFAGYSPNAGSSPPFHAPPPMPSMPDLSTTPTPPMPGAFPCMQPSYPRNGLHSFPFGRGQPAQPGMAAWHGGWPFTSTTFPFGNPVASPFGPKTPGPQTREPAVSAAQIHDQALQMDAAAQLKEDTATALRTQATGPSVGEKERAKLMDEASKLEEEGEKYRLEAGRLRAEATHLDGELARELHEGHEHGYGDGMLFH